MKTRVKDFFALIVTVGMIAQTHSAKITAASIDKEQDLLEPVGDLDKVTGLMTRQRQRDLGMMKKKSYYSSKGKGKGSYEEDCIPWPDTPYPTAAPTPHPTKKRRMKKKNKKNKKKKMMMKKRRELGGRGRSRGGLDRYRGGSRGMSSGKGKGKGSYPVYCSDAPSDVPSGVPSGVPSEAPSNVPSNSPVLVITPGKEEIAPEAPEAPGKEEAGQYGTCDSQDVNDNSLVGCTSCAPEDQGDILYFERTSGTCAFCYCEVPAAVNPYVDLCNECKE